jgi:hypothetical protein
VRDRGRGPGTVWATGVVGVLAVGDGGQPVAAYDLVGDPPEQLVLTVKAAIRRVAPIPGPLASNV